MQLLLFEESQDVKNAREVEVLKNKVETLRRSMWRENNLMKKEIKELKADVEFLKAKICKEGMFL
jgi:hypothetical protein